MSPSETTARALPTTWAAAFFGLLTGIMLVYFPYEFSAAVFRFIYEDARLLGTLFLTGSLLLGVAALYPEWPRGLDLAGRVVFLAATGAFWWNGAVANGAYTGIWCYLLLMGFVVWEAKRPSPRTFLHFTVLAAAGIGAVMVSGPPLLRSEIYRHTEAHSRILGVAFVAGALLLAWGRWRGSRAFTRAGLWALLLSFASMAVTLLAVRSWSGVGLYLAVSAGIGAQLLPALFRAKAGIRWQLWRAMVIASCVPLIALGAVACVVMQRSLERQALAEALTAADAEVEWLDQHFDGERDALMAHARLPSFQRAVQAADVERLAPFLQVLKFPGLDFEAVFVLDAEGRVLARTVPGFPRRDFQGDRDYFLQALGEQDIVFSVPFVGMDAQPRVAMAVSVRADDAAVGVLVGTFSLAALSGENTLASRRYQVLLVDRRSGKLLRETATGSVGVDAWLPQPVAEALPGAERGAWVGPDARAQQTMVAWSRVPGTDWLVVARQPAQAAYRAVTRLGMGAALFVTIGALLALFVSHLVALGVTRRLARVRDAAAEMAAGDLSVRVTREREDELGALADAFNQLGARVQAAQADLQRSNAELTRAVATRDQFLSLASHELRTPLTPLKATVHTLRLLLQRTDGSLDPQRVATLLDRADRQTDRLRNLVTDMLDTSRIQAGLFVLKPEPVDLAAMVVEVVERHTAAHPHVAERLRVERPPGPVEGVWDGPRLEQVVVNLLENALRYSPGGEPVWLVVEGGPELVRFSVRDRGIGIPEESLPHLFQPFYRAPNAAENHFGGLGLGLHICREIVHRHGGRIWAESEGPGRGTRLHIELPRRVDAAAGAATGGTEKTSPPPGDGRAA